ncbi:hypothetical protein [Duganella sp. HH101]|nr:hypothetical protein [Duganella sp. HH101]
MKKTPPAIPGTYVRMLFDYLEGQGCAAAAVLGESAPAVDAGGPSYSAYFGDRDRPFRRIVTAAQRAVLRAETLMHAVTMRCIFQYF